MIEWICILIVRRLFFNDEEIVCVEVLLVVETVFYVDGFGMK